MLPAVSTLKGFFSQRFQSFISPHWNPGLWGLSQSSVVPPGLSAHKCGTTHSTLSATLPEVFSIQRPISSPSTDLDECFFFNFLVVGLPYRSIFCQFWLFFLFLNLLLFFFWWCEEAQYISLCSHLGWKFCVLFTLKISNIELQLSYMWSATVFF